MRTEAVSVAGGSKPNEDSYVVAPGLVIVVDGATARTDTGCCHGVKWYSENLGAEMAQRLISGLNLRHALSSSISAVADSHRETCDLTHPGTPSAAIGAVHVKEDYLEWILLGDVTIVIDGDSSLTIVTDQHDHVARMEQEEADRYPIGNPKKNAAMVRMKHVELAARNVVGGFWIACTDPSAADHAKTGKIPLQEVSQVLAMSDGAARLAVDFHLMSWQDMVDTASRDGVGELTHQVRKAENSDPVGNQWPRNKKSDDATVVLASFSESFRN